MAISTGFSMPVNEAAICGNCEVIFYLRDRACPRCGSEISWGSLGRMLDALAKKNPVDTKPKVCYDEGKHGNGS